MDFLLHQGKIIGSADFNPGAEWLDIPVTGKLSMWFANGEIPFFSAHLEELNRYFEWLQRDYTTHPAFHGEMRRLCLRLINKNKAYMGGWVHIHVWVREKSWDYTARVEKYPSRTIPFQEPGILADVATEVKWSATGPGRSRLMMNPLWERDRLKISGTRFSEMLYFNEKGSLVEAIGSNLFCISRNRLITPAPETGCYEDFLRTITLDAAHKLSMEVSESDNIRMDDLLKMDEIFCVSEKQGFTWIMGIGTKRYVKKFSDRIRDGVDALLWK